MSPMFLISRLEYMLRRPSVASAMTRAPCTVSAIIALTALDTSGSAIALIEVRFRAEQEVHRHHAGLRRQRRGIRRGGNAEFDVARFHQLQDLRLLPELRAGILVDQHRALAQVLELVGEDIAEDAVTRRLRLIVGEAIMLHFLRAAPAAIRSADAATTAPRIFPRLLIVSPFSFFSSSHRGCLNVNRTTDAAQCNAGARWSCGRHHPREQ